MDLALSIALPVGLGALSGYATVGETRGAWYAGLVKPSWQPPSWLFGPVWTALYAMMGAAAALVWRAQGFGAALVLYAIQLCLNVAWSFIFFKKHSLTLALVDILGLVLALLATVPAFYAADPRAGLLMLPYLAWVLFATSLNATLWRLN